MSNFSTMHRGNMTDHATSIGNIDVTKKADLEKLVKQIEEKEKCIHLLGMSFLLQQELMILTLVVVANAGVPGPKAEPDKEDAVELKEKLWEGESVEEWNETYSTDVTSVYFTTVAFLPLLQAAMEPKGSGEKFSASVITTSSMSGIMRHAQGHFAYVNVFYMRKIQANHKLSQLQRSQGCNCPSDQADVCRVHEGRHQSQLNRSWILPQRNDSQELRRQTEERPPCREGSRQGSRSSDAWWKGRRDGPRYAAAGYHNLHQRADHSY